MTINNEALIRDLKIRYITGGLDLIIKDDVVKRFENELDFIVKKFNNYIISGSLALNLYGLLDRKIGDIDLIISSDLVDTEFVKINLVLGSYYGVGADVNYLGYSYINWRPSFFSRKRKYKVDFILNDNVVYYELNYKNSILKIQNPISIIEKKHELIKLFHLGSYKNIKDLNDIFDKCFH
jgi:hypothetical protein